MILHTPLYDFCDGKLYGENIVIIRNEFQEISFFKNKYTWKDVRTLLKNIKSKSAINLHDHIEVQAYTEKEQEEYLSYFKRQLMSDLIFNGIPTKHQKDTILFTYRGKVYTTSIPLLLKLFNLHKYNDIANLQPTSFGFKVCSEPTTIPATDSEGKLELVTVQNRIANTLLENLQVEYKKYKEILNRLLEYIHTTNPSTEENLVELYRVIYGIDIYSKDFKYQHVDVPRIKL